MRNLVYRYAPIVFGLILGKILIHPPPWLEQLGAARWLVNGGLVGLLVLFSVPLLVLANLPQEVAMKASSESDLSDDQRRLAAAYEGLGFRRVGPPLRVAVAPEAIVQGFVHEREPVYGSVFRTTTVPPKTCCDLVSILDGERGGLTTNAEPMGATLAAGAGGFRQVLPGSPVEHLFRAHLDGIAFLKSRGLGVRPATADRYEIDLRSGLRKQREVFLSSPVQGSLLTFWRSATRNVPFLGPLAEQEVAQRQIRALVSGRSNRVF